LPAEPAALLPALLGLLETLRYVPLERADGGLVGLRDHVLAAATLASTLRRAVQAKLDEGPSTWVTADAPYWLLAAVHLDVERGPYVPAADTPAQRQAQAAATHEGLQAVRARLAAALGRRNLDVEELAHPAAGRLLLLLPATAAEPLNRVLADVQAALAGRAVVGLAGLPVSAAALAGGEARVAPMAAEVLRDA